MADIAITYTEILGENRSDPNATVCIWNVSGFKTMQFLNKHRSLMQSALIGCGHPVLTIAQHRVPKFIAYAAKHGLVAERMSRKEMLAA